MQHSWTRGALRAFVCESIGYVCDVRLEVPKRSGSSLRLRLTRSFTASTGTNMHQAMALSPLASASASLTLPEAECILTYDPLDASKIITSVQDDGAGATAVFIGTTRDSFKGVHVCSFHLIFSQQQFLIRKDCQSFGISSI